ncbi:MAG: 2,3-bisphosphoglycerate-independent phosphoglycerate mutase [Clostridia bacterium]|nr:2,3-bisphosphoglycerate-independent phosphoglycerate mutase [Clostridia bacterium]
MKCITLLLDGASDRSYKVLNHQTPLQYAVLPHLNRIAKDSQCGMMTILKEGDVLGTDLAHFILFGGALKDYPGRAIIDAIGEDLKIEENILYLRCSIGTVLYEKGYYLKHRFTPDLSEREISALKKVLDMSLDGYEFTYMHSYDSHGFVLVKGDLDSRISDSDPFTKESYVMAVEAFETDDEKAIKTAEVINKYLKRTYELLSTHEINVHRRANLLPEGNMILTKWAGMKREIQSFADMNGLSSVLIGNSKLLKGISQILNMDYYHYEKFEDAVAYALTCSYDYVHLHTKEPDTASHKKNPLLKVKALEAIDQALEPLMNFEGLLIVTSDHSTPCSGEMIHSGESVAFMARGEYIRKDDVEIFDEIACAKGSLHLKGQSFMSYIINGMDQGVMYHLRQGSHKRKYQIKKINKLK